jgi:hypothetical protein
LRLQRAQEVTVQIVGTAAEAGTAGSLDGSGVIGAAVDVGVSIRPFPGASDASGGNAWLSQDGSCNAASPFNTLPLITEPGSGSATFYVCADGTSGTYQLSAIAGQSLGSEARAVSSTVVVQPEVAHAVATSTSCGQDAGTPGDIVMHLQDCIGNPVAVQGATWSVPGSTASPTTFSSGSDGSACIDAHAMTDAGPSAGAPASLNLSFCSSAVAVGGT